MAQPVVAEEQDTDSQPRQSTNRGGLRVKSEYLPRQAEALKRLLAGENFETIADELGYADRSGAYRACMAALKRSVNQDADEVRSMEVKRIDRMLEASWPIATATIEASDPEGNPAVLTARMDQQLKAQATVLKLMERRAKYIGGLESPAQLDIKHEVATQDEFAAYLLGYKEAYDTTKAEA